jgi:uncharacterized protein YqeY
MLRTRLSEALKDAMRAKDERKVGTVRLILSALKMKDIEARPAGKADGIGDPEILQMMNGMIKQGNRPELAKQEAEEIEIIQSFMPKQMDEAETAAAVKEAIAASGAASVKDMGKVMAVLKEKYTGKMDFSKVSGVVKQQLGA